MPNVDVLLAAPHAPELEGLESILGPTMSATVQGIHVVAKTVGLGLPGVAAGTTQRPERYRPRAVILLSTCAAYGHRGLTPGQVVVAERLVIADAAVLKGWASFPEPMVGEIHTHAGLVGGLTTAGTRRVSAASSCSLTSDVQLAADIVARLGCDVEHNEVFGVALACAAYQIPFAAVFGVAYEIGPKSQETWRTTHRTATMGAASLIAAWLRAGAVGVPHGTPPESPITLL